MAPRGVICRSLTALLAACVAACAAAPAGAPAALKPARQPCRTGPAFAAGAERATLWVRDSAEYRAASVAIYRAALDALARGLADPAWTAEPTQAGDLSGLPPAVVMDVDETVLDNSESEVRLLLDGACFDEFPAAWDAWVAKRSAPAVPGAIEFIRAARAMTDPAGRPVRIFFITNRECARRAGGAPACPQKEDTAANLRALGLGSEALDEELLVQGERPEWQGEKLSRRLQVARGYRIVLNIGDDLADFMPGVRRGSVAERERARCTRQAYWGRRWFVIPNPIYGSWLVALGTDPGSALRAGPPAARGCREP